MTDNKALTIKEERSSAVAGFGSSEGFELLQRIGNAFSKSDLVPDTYKNNIGNCLIGVELAQRIGASPLMVMQNLHVIQGRPSFSSAFVISAINSCGRFSPLRFRVKDRGIIKVDYTYSSWDKQTNRKERKTGSLEVHDFSCVAYAKDLADGEILEGPEVSIKMAVQEGWYTKNDSKWKTMPELMLRYRAAAFFGRLYAPEILMGMRTDDEAVDISPTIIDVTPEATKAATQGTEALNAGIAKQAKRGRPPAAAKASEPVETPPVIDAEVIEQEPDHSAQHDNENHSQPENSDDLWEE